MRRGKQRTANVEHRTQNEEGNQEWLLGEGGARERKYDLEERLLEFASQVIDLSEKMPNTRAANHVAGQILRSGTSPYPNHGEVESAESRDDFIHKIKICLKELRETRRWTRLIQRKQWTQNDSILRFVLSESEELIRIFMASITTARQNALEQKRKMSNRAIDQSGAAD